MPHVASAPLLLFLRRRDLVFMVLLSLLAPRKWPTTSLHRCSSCCRGLSSSLATDSFLTSHRRSRRSAPCGIALRLASILLRHLSGCVFGPAIHDTPTWHRWPRLHHTKRHPRRVDHRLLGDPQSKRPRPASAACPGLDDVTEDPCTVPRHYGNQRTSCRVWPRPVELSSSVARVIEVPSRGCG